MDEFELNTMAVPSRKTIVEKIDSIIWKEFIFTDPKKYCECKAENGKVLIFDGEINSKGFFQSFLNSTSFCILNKECVFFESEENFVDKIIFYSGNTKMFLDLFSDVGLCSQIILDKKIEEEPIQTAEW